MCYDSKKSKRNLRVIFVSGFSNSGKTTLIELLVPRLRQRGLRVGTIKHAHEGYEVDHPGKDSWRHAHAGASAVILISPKQVTSFIQTEQEKRLADVIHQMAPTVNLILVEGFRRSPGRKILIERSTSRLRIGHNLCRIGVFPGDLSPLELKRIVQFCEGENGDGAGDREDRGSGALFRATQRPIRIL